jgi:hypothetical protein
VYHSKVVVICWVAVFLSAALMAAVKKRWRGLGLIAAGAGMTVAGIAISAWLDHPVAALILAALLLAAALTTLLGIVNVFQQPSG